MNKTTTSIVLQRPRTGKTPLVADGYKRLSQRDVDTFIEIIERTSIHDLEKLRDALDQEIAFSLACIADNEEQDDRTAP